MHKTDVLIIGAGPVGLFAVFEAGLLGMKSHIVDSLETPGGQCSALYPEKPIYDIPAYPKIAAGDLVDNLLEQIKPFSPEFHLNQQAVSFKKFGDNKFITTTNKGVEIESKIIVIAAGCGAFGPNRPPLEGIENYEGKSVFYYIKDPERFRDKKVAIAGGGDSAADWAIILSDIAEKVYLIHRRSKFRAAPSSMEKINSIYEKNKKIELITPYQLGSIEGNGSDISSLGLYDLNKNIKKLEIDYLLPFFGLSMDLGPIKDWELELSQSRLSVDITNCMTNIEGIYAIGDVADYEGKLKLIVSGFSEAATAIHHSYRRVFDGKPLHFEYSTNKNIRD